METIRNIISNFNMQLKNESRFVLFGVGASVGLAIGLTFWYRRKDKTRIPTGWIKIGELSDLMCFPVKSCGVIRENEFECTALGLRKGAMCDRRFMLIDLHGRFITGRQYPSLVKITPIFKDNKLILTAPGMMDHVLDIDTINRRNIIRATMWGENVITVDCGEEVARWFSRFLLSEDTGFRFVYFPFSKTTRDYRLRKNQIFDRIRRVDSGALHDSTNYNLVTESSVMELNTRLEVPVTPQNFRPNFVVKGTKMYEEDNWNYIRIGSTAVFQNVKPSIRCSFITVDPETGIKNTKLDPLNTLKKYRQITDPALRPCVGDAPVMGLNLGLRVPGIVKLGDPVYIGVET